jgi:hypothetical protein
MTRTLWIALCCVGWLCAGCPNHDAAGGSGGAAAVSGGGRPSSGGAGSAAPRGGAGSSARAGAGGGRAGEGGQSGGDSCANVAIPASCKLCSDNRCGTPTCSSGKFTGFVCPEDADAGAADAGSGGASGSAASGAFHWFQGCGTPVCRADDNPFDDPSIRNCTSEKLGDACATEGERCDGVLSCGATYICATRMPSPCPISRARFKQDIRYLDDASRRQVYEELTRIRLATYHYKAAPEVDQLGFMIDDVEPSVATSGDQVNMYGYLSMAVAAIQVQDQRIRALERELAELRTRTAGERRSKPKR